MAHPHKANDKDEELEDLDPAVAEDLAFARALQNSLEVSLFPQSVIHLNLP